MIDAKSNTPMIQTLRRKDSLFKRKTSKPKPKPKPKKTTKKPSTTLTTTTTTTTPTPTTTPIPVPLCSFAEDWPKYEKTKTKTKILKKKLWNRVWKMTPGFHETKVRIF